MSASFELEKELIPLIERKDIIRISNFLEKFNQKYLSNKGTHIRFRPVDWTGKAVAHVQKLTYPYEEVNPLLYKRVFSGEKSLKEVEGLVGLVVWLKNNALSRSFKRDLCPQKDRKFIGELYNHIIKKGKLSDAYMFNNLNKTSDASRYFKTVKDYFSKKVEASGEKATAWGKMNKTIKRATWNDFDNLLSGNILLKKNEQQWKDLWDKCGGNKIQFIKKIEGTEKYYNDQYEYWKKFCKDLECIKHIIAIPITVDGELLGVLTVDSGEQEAFDEVELKNCFCLALLIASGYLKIRGKVFMGIRKAVNQIVSADSFEEIASEIASGIRQSFVFLPEEKVYPLLYTYTGNELIKLTSKTKKSASELNPNEWRFELRKKPKDNNRNSVVWKTEKFLGGIQVRPKGLGWRTISSWLNGKESICVVEDVDNPDSSLGSRTAMEKEVKTTICKVLTYDNTLYGLLYVHITTPHSLTRFERHTIEAYADTAAITIYHHKEFGQSYENFFGKSPLDSLRALKKSPRRRVSF